MNTQRLWVMFFSAIGTGALWLALWRFQWHDVPRGSLDLLIAIVMFIKAYCEED
jgi:hypothetical protein